MATLTQVTTSHFPITHTPITNWLASYQIFIANAEFYRIGWAASALIIQGCLLSPAVLLTMAYLGGGDWQFLVSNLCFLLILIPFCSALSVKYIIPAFVFSFIVHLVIVLINVL